MIVHEVGYLPGNQPRQETYLSLHYVSYRYENITSNKLHRLAGALRRYGAPAILDRLLHHCKVVNIKGHSYRLQAHSFGDELSDKEGDAVGAG